MQQRRGPGRGAPKEGVPTTDSAGVKDAAAADPPLQLRAPRHGGYTAAVSRSGGREAQMLRGEPGYHLGGCLILTIICAGNAVVDHTDVLCSVKTETFL